MRSLLAALFIVLTQLSAHENGLLAAEVSDKKGASLSAQLNSKDVLSIKNGRFFLEGEPFAEISFNKFDLFWQLYDELAGGKQLNPANPMVQAQDKALRNLHELGFKTIRIFALPW